MSSRRTESPWSSAAWRCRASPGKRERIVELTGQSLVPVLLEDDGTATHDSSLIVQRIRSGALSASSGAGR